MRGRCHCGTVTFEVRPTDGVATARRCDCSLCARRGAVAISAPLDGITYLTGADNLTLYQFGTKVAEHWFCKTCGIYTHHRRRSDPGEIGVNLACLDGYTPFLPEVIVNDGINHPSDGPSGRAGILRFTPEVSE
ncbi:GFA family protein [Jannaschia sp. S6380]|uniref:GFA family protein n=1 Tax=Jannaschia sp. S6380 TaxID=2926408 RepID=UPI001FF6EE56|nr:GFA family protein [Jannaschia sp. S6380]MCK0168310.1 GFA family protein [Jannaschia sp. S6380]